MEVIRSGNCTRPCDHTLKMTFFINIISTKVNMPLMRRDDSGKRFSVLKDVKWS